MPGQTEHECPQWRQCHKRRSLRNRFEIVKTLGQGTYGKVKLAIERETGQPVSGICFLYSYFMAGLALP